MWYTYLIGCEDKSIYTGMTNNLEERFRRHKSGKGGHYTMSHKPLKILYCEEFESKKDAMRREAEIKRWTREKKLRLIAGAASHSLESKTSK